MRNPAETYLKDVLGVNTVIAPVDGPKVAPAVRGSGHFQVTGDFSADTAVVSFTPVIFGERELCQKMLMAIGAGPLLLIEFSDAIDREAFAEFFGAFTGSKVWCFGEPSAEFIAAAGDRKILSLPKLATLTDQADPELMAKKRDVWSKLQNFQKANS